MPTWHNFIVSFRWTMTLAYISASINNIRMREITTLK